MTSLSNDKSLSDDSSLSNDKSLLNDLSLSNHLSFEPSHSLFESQCIGPSPPRCFCAAWIPSACMRPDNGHGLGVRGGGGLQLEAATRPPEEDH